MSGTIDSIGKIASSRKSRACERQLASTLNQGTLGAVSERLIIDKPGTTVAITVKTKGHKTGQPILKNSSTSVPEVENQIERKKRLLVLAENKSNWPGTFREQTKASFKQSLNQPKERPGGSKTARGSSGDHTESGRMMTDSPFVHSSAMPPSCSNSSESVIVTDKGVQCGGLFDSSYNHFNLLNPIRTIAFLMKELESLVQDEKSCTILSQMEQALSRVPSDVGKSLLADHEAVIKHTQLEASVAKLAATGKEMQNTVESMRKEKIILLQQLEEKSIHLESSLRREAGHEALIKDLRQKLSESSKLDLTNKKSSNEKNEKIQLLQNITTELKIELNEQTELAQQRFLECQFLKMEKEKLSVISSFKDSQLVEHRKAIKNLQDLIGDQLINIKKASRLEDATFIPDVNLSLIGGGRASSSPVQSVNNSVIITNTGHDVVDMSEPSISTIDVRSSPTMMSKHQSSQLRFSIDGSEYHGEEFREKAHLEFTSIGGDEGSILERNADEFIYVVPESGQRRMSPRDIDDEQREGRRDVKESRRESVGKRAIAKSQEIKEEIQMMYEKTRINSKVKVKVPSPPRNYPHPDWSDSSLPTVSMSESNVV